MLKAIGLGYPRTGTMSLKHALEALELGPCYHMIEVFHHPQDVPFWSDVMENNGQGADWDAVFGDFPASVDAPACYYWRSLAEYYPDAKFILTVRDADTWYKSLKSTIYESMLSPDSASSDQHLVVKALVKRMIFDTVFEGKFADQASAIKNFHEHNQSIQDFFSDDRLLVLEISEGWKPLCEFLGVPVPDIPFPRSNSRDDFRKRFDIPSSREP